jgi:hypothetical protein
MFKKKYQQKLWFYNAGDYKLLESKKRAGVTRIRCDCLHNNIIFFYKL